MQDDPYIPEDQIGAGPSGMVYRGHDLDNSQSVRLKVLLQNHVSCPVDISMIEALMPRLLSLRHPNVVSTSALDVRDDEVTLVSDFVSGENGWAWCRERRVTQAEAISILRQLLQTIGAGARMGLFHGDIKPSNMILDATESGGPRLQLQDWGLSYCRPYQPQETLAFRAPERHGEANPSEQTELFSAGAAVAALLIGQPLVGGASADTLLSEWQGADGGRSIFGAERPDLTAAFGDLMAWLLSGDPTRRPETAQVVIEALDDLERRGRRGSSIVIPGRQALPPPNPPSSSWESENECFVKPEPELLRNQEPSKKKGCSCLAITLLALTVLAGVAAWVYYDSPAWSEPYWKLLEQGLDALQKEFNQLESRLRH